MVEGKNDSRECAMQLVELVRGLNCHINLIPLNPVEGRMGQRSKGADIQNFKLLLEKNHTNVTIRREMGRDKQKPLDFARDEIKEILINLKRVEFINKVKEDLYQRASDRNKIIYYYLNSDE